MREAVVARALAQLQRPGGVLAEWRDDGFGVFRSPDRRRRPLVRLRRAEVMQLASEGAIVAQPGGIFVLSEAGVARARREAAPAPEAYAAQHRTIIDRAAIDAEGRLYPVRGHCVDAPLRRLAKLCDTAGRPLFDAAELAAATQLRRDWEASEVGMMHGSDPDAAPIGSSPRTSVNAQEAAMARRCDARKHVAEALARLAPPLRRAVERVCLHEVGLEELERSEAWPARCGKLALKLGLAQLAATL
ncbi:MAG: DUF6456 domain-containing protein [Hyphomonadaceae bacterium]